MSFLNEYDKRKCRELGASIMRVALRNRPAACLIFLESIEHVACGADEAERATIALMMVRSALKIDKTILDARH